MFDAPCQTCEDDDDITLAELKEQLEDDMTLAELQDRLLEEEEEEETTLSSLLEFIRLCAPPFIPPSYIQI